MIADELKPIVEHFRKTLEEFEKFIANDPESTYCECGHVKTKVKYIDNEGHCIHEPDVEDTESEREENDREIKEFDEKFMKDTKNVIQAKNYVNRQKILECDCGFKGKINDNDSKLTCPKCFIVYEKIYSPQTKPYHFDEEHGNGMVHSRSMELTSEVDDRPQAESLEKDKTGDTKEERTSFDEFKELAEKNNFDIKEFHRKLGERIKSETKPAPKAGDFIECPDCKHGHNAFWVCLGEPEGDFYSCENCSGEFDKDGNDPEDRQHALGGKD